MMSRLTSVSVGGFGNLRTNAQISAFSQVLMTAVMTMERFIMSGRAVKWLRPLPMTFPVFSFSHEMLMGSPWLCQQHDK